MGEHTHTLSLHLKPQSNTSPRVNNAENKWLMSEGGANINRHKSHMHIVYVLMNLGMSTYWLLCPKWQTSSSKLRSQEAAVICFQHNRSTKQFQKDSTLRTAPAPRTKHGPVCHLVIRLSGMGPVPMMLQALLFGVSPVILTLACRFGKRLIKNVLKVYWLENKTKQHKTSRRITFAFPNLP